MVVAALLTLLGYCLASACQQPQCQLRPELNVIRSLKVDALRFTIPIASTFLLRDWRTALDMSLAGHTHGKLMLVSRRIAIPKRKVSKTSRQGRSRNAFAAAMSPRSVPDRNCPK